MENNLLYFWYDFWYNIYSEVDFWYNIYLCFFYFVEKMGNFHFVVVKIEVDHENLLNLILVVVYFEFVNISSSECS